MGTWAVVCPRRPGRTSSCWSTRRRRAGPEAACPRGSSRRLEAFDRIKRTRRCSRSSVPLVHGPGRAGRPADAVDQLRASSYRAHPRPGGGKGLEPGQGPVRWRGTMAGRVGEEGGGSPACLRRAAARSGTPSPTPTAGALNMARRAGGGILPRRATGDGARRGGQRCRDSDRRDDPLARQPGGEDPAPARRGRLPGVVRPDPVHPAAAVSPRFPRRGST